MGVAINKSIEKTKILLFKDNDLFCFIDIEFTKLFRDEVLTDDEGGGHTFTDNHRHILSRIVTHLEILECEERAINNRTVFGIAASLASKSSLEMMWSFRKRVASL